jgi:hypothetical protein
MMTQAQYEQRDDRPTDDSIVRLSGLRWDDYQRLLKIRGDRYVSTITSEVLPGLNLGLLTRFLDQPTTYDAIHAYRHALRSADSTH